MSAVKGRCHCGENEYQVKLEDASKAHILCHCDACQKVSGTDSTMNQIVPQENFEHIKGSLTRYTYKGDSGNPVYCYFCPSCSTHIYHHQTTMGPKYVIRTATLEGSKEWPVAAEIYGNNMASWQPKVASTVHPLGPDS